MDFNNLPAQDKIYYNDGFSHVIYCADCREILPELSGISAIVTDPPYGINLNLEWLSEIHLRQGKPANIIDIPIVGDDSFDPSLLWRFPNRLIFGFPYIYDPQATGWLVWDKQPGLLDTDRTMTTPIEVASTTLWKGYRLVRCMWAGYMRDGGEHRYEHPTQKPLKVIKYCINKTPLDSLILDPFLGSGTTLVAAKILGRKCVGIEISEAYCKIAAQRLSQSVMPLAIPKTEIKQEGLDGLD